MSGTECSSEDVSSAEKRVAVGQVNTVVKEGETIAHLFRRLNAGMPEEAVSVDMHHHALFHAEDVPQRREPDLADKVPADLSTVDDGDELDLYRLPYDDRPAYYEEAEA